MDTTTASTALYIKLPYNASGHNSKGLATAALEGWCPTDDSVLQCCSYGGAQPGFTGGSCLQCHAIQPAGVPQRSRKALGAAFVRVAQAASATATADCTTTTGIAAASSAPHLATELLC